MVEMLGRGGEAWRLAGSRWAPQVRGSQQSSWPSHGWTFDIMCYFEACIFQTLVPWLETKGCPGADGKIATFTIYPPTTDASLPPLQSSGFCGAVAVRAFYVLTPMTVASANRSVPTGRRVCTHWSTAGQPPELPANPESTRTTTT